VVASADARLEK